MSMLRRAICGVLVPHRWKFQPREQVCIGATINWLVILCRMFRDTHRCEICGAVKTETGIRNSQSLDDDIGPRDGWDDDLWPLDKHGNCLPLAADVEAGRKPLPECSWGLFEKGAKFRTYEQAAKAGRAKATRP